MTREIAIPFPAFHFEVDFGGSGSFAEIVGMCSTRSVVAYRSGDDLGPRFLTTTSVPGPVSLRRGVVGTLDLYRWHETAEPRDVIVSLLDQDHRPVQRWLLHRCVPIGIVGPHLGSQRNEVAIEELTLQPESVEVE